MRHFVGACALLLFVVSFLPVCSAETKDGWVKEYYKSGELKVKAQYRDGVQDGIEKRFDKDGRLVQEATFRNGKMIKSYAFAPERDLGPMGFLLDYRICLSVLAVGVALWFLFSKVLLKGKF